MEITNDGNELKLVEVANTGDDYLVFQVWETDEEGISVERDNIADPEEVYAVNIVGKLENPEEYGGNFEYQGGLVEVAPQHYEWSAGGGKGRDVHLFGYDESDPRDGDIPETAAELAPYQDTELEEIMGSAFSGVTVGEYRNR